MSEAVPKKKCAVVTGGAGFVGSHLCERLVADGWHVISLDNYFTGSYDNHVPGVQYRVGHTKEIAKHIPETPDIIFHLGEYARVEQSVLEPDIVHDLNTLGTRGVVAFWQEKKCKLVYAGSSTKFGDDGETRYTSPYARTKAENSELVRDVGERERLPYAITYFYNVYGPRERSGVYGTVIEHFKHMYRSGAPCAIVLPGTQERNFTHVLDIVEGLIVVGERGAGDEFGLGSSEAFSITAVADLFGFKENRVLFPPRVGNRMTSRLDPSRAQALGWSATRRLSDYIEEFKKTKPPGVPREKRVLVFTTTFAPTAGLAEDAVVELARALPTVTFDVITSAFTTGAHAAPPPAPNIVVHRVGFGNRFDKFLLPFWGVIQGAACARKNQYLFAWGVMASYGGLAALLLKLFFRLPLLITLADQNIDDMGSVQRTLFSLLVSRADQVYGTHRLQEEVALAVSARALPRNSLGEGDAFANALRFAYADIVRQDNRSKKKL